MNNNFNRNISPRYRRIIIENSLNPILNCIAYLRTTVTTGIFMGSASYVFSVPSSNRITTWKHFLLFSLKKTSNSSRANALWHPNNTLCLLQAWKPVRSHFFGIYATINYQTKIWLVQLRKKVSLIVFYVDPNFR